MILAILTGLAVTGVLLYIGGRLMQPHRGQHAFKLPDTHYDQPEHDQPEPEFGDDDEELDDDDDDDELDDEEFEEYETLEVEYAGDDTLVFYGYASNVELYQDVARWEAIINSRELESTPWLVKA